MCIRDRDKVGRLTRGVGGFIQGIADTPKNLTYWAAEKFIPDEDLDSPEERRALMEAIGTMTRIAPGLPGAAAGLDSAANFLSETSAPLIKDREHADFIDAFGEGEVLEGADMLLGDVIEAIPSVAAAFSGPGGLALIGSSAFGNKFSDEFEEDPLSLIHISEPTRPY